MVTIQEARSQLQQARQTLSQRQEEQRQAEAQAGEAKRLSQAQTYLRSKSLLERQKVGRNISNVQSQLSQRGSALNEAEQTLRGYEGEIQKAEKIQTDFERAREVYRRGLPVMALENREQRNFYKQFQFDSDQAAIDSAEKQLNMSLPQEERTKILSELNNPNMSYASIDDLKKIELPGKNEMSLASDLDLGIKEPKPGPVTSIYETFTKAVQAQKNPTFIPIKGQNPLTSSIIKKIAPSTIFFAPFVGGPITAAVAAETALTEYGRQSVKKTGEDVSNIVGIKSGPVKKIVTLGIGAGSLYIGGLALKQTAQPVVKSLTKTDVKFLGVQGEKTGAQLGLITETNPLFTKQTPFVSTSEVIKSTSGTKGGIDLSNIKINIGGKNPKEILASEIIRYEQTPVILSNLDKGIFSVARGEKATSVLFTDDSLFFSESIAAQIGKRTSIVGGKSAEVISKDGTLGFKEITPSVGLVREPRIVEEVTEATKSSNLFFSGKTTKSPRIVEQIEESSKQAQAAIVKKSIGTPTTTIKPARSYLDLKEIKQQVQTSNMTPLMSAQIEIPVQETRLIIKPKSSLDLKANLAQSNTQRERMLQSPMQFLKDISKQGQSPQAIQVYRTAQEQRSLQLVSQKQIQLLKQRQASRSALRPRQPIQPKKPRAILVPLLLPGRFKLKSISEVESQFESFGRVKGKDVLLGTFKTKSQAENKLKGFLKGTLGAGGFIERKGERLDFGELEGFGSEFRPGKRDTTRVIQKRSFRLGTQSERFSIQKARRNNRFSLFD